MQKLLIFLSINILLLTSCLNQQESNENLLLIDINDAKYNSLKFSIEDFKNIGFKVSKEYDVSELPGAISADLKEYILQKKLQEKMQS